MTRKLVLAAAVVAVCLLSLSDSAYVAGRVNGWGAGATTAVATSTPRVPTNVGRTARAILRWVVGDLRGRRLDGPAASAQLHAARRHLRAALDPALDPALWAIRPSDGNHVVRLTGGRVFRRSAYAASSLEVVRHSPAAWVVSGLRRDIRRDTSYVTGANRLLATTMISDNACSPRVPWHLRRARDLLAAGDVRVRRDRPAVAIDDYHAAWRHAGEAHGRRCSVKQFKIAGDVVDLLYPGASGSVDLVFTNPNRVAITVRSVTIAVDPTTSSPGCDGTTNLLVTHSLIGTATVPARSTRSLSQLAVPTDRWPVLTMPDLPVNQDACKETTFTLHYTGSATR